MDAVERQQKFAEELAFWLEDASAVDVLDALATAHLMLTEGTQANPAHDAYRRMLSD